MKLYNGLRVTVKIKKWFRKVNEVGIVVANVLTPIIIKDHETDMPLKTDWFLVWTFSDNKTRQYHRLDIDTNVTKLRVFDA